MALEIEHVEQWLGKTVVGPDGEKIGRLDDIVYASDGTPVYGAVTTGLFGHLTSLVPLAQAMLSPDHIAVPYDKGQVKGAPQLVEPGEMSSTIEDEATAHYREPVREQALDERYVTAIGRQRQAKDVVDIDVEAQKLEQHADEIGAQAENARSDAQNAQERADALAREHEAALVKAREARGQQARIDPSVPRD